MCCPQTRDHLSHSVQHLHWQLLLVVELTLELGRSRSKVYSWVELL
jgi:hypothetical protein